LRKLALKKRAMDMSSLIELTLVSLNGSWFLTAVGFEGAVDRQK
jgi:hypothetical protein